MFPLRHSSRTTCLALLLAASGCQSDEPGDDPEVPDEATAPGVPAEPDPVELPPVQTVVPPAPAELDAGPMVVEQPDAGEPEPMSSGPAMTFFVTSEGMGSGGDLGGLSGGDAHCQRLANRASAGDRTWRALLSSDFIDGRSRVGEGPWHNEAGVQIASNLEELFSTGISFGPTRLRAMLDEYGEPVPSSSHDILSGTDGEGVRVVRANCAGWTSNADFDVAIVGHSDSSGAQGANPNHSWISAHLTGGCSQANLTADGGDARLYCFAID